MAKGKFITENEREVMRVGYHFNVPQNKVAAALERSPAVVTQQLQKMRENGTIGDLPLPFMAEIIRKGLEA